MIVFAMDETGWFEEGELRRNQCSVIGGFGFMPNGSEGDTIDCEKERIKHFIQDACNKNGARFPQDLHEETETTKRVKKQLMKGLKAFLNEKKNGIYYLFGIAVDLANSPVITNNAGNVVSDRIASNRYEHASCRSLENLLLFNPKIDIKKTNLVQLDIATRVTAGNEESINQYGDLGHATTKRGKYVVTDAASYRSVLARVLSDSQQQDMDMILNICSTDYNPLDDAESTKEEKINRNVLLYFADVICSYYRSVILTQRCESGGEVLHALTKSCNDNLGIDISNLMFWSYSRIDNTYRDAYQALEKNDFYESLYLMTEREGLKAKRNKQTEYYSKYWFSLLRKKQHTVKDQAVKLRGAIQNLTDYLESPGYRLVYADRMYNDLEEQAAHYSIVGNPQIFAELYRCGMALDNHHGNYEEALEKYKKCLPLARYMSAEDFVNLRNMNSVRLSDSGDYEEAISVASETIEFVQQVNSLYEKWVEGGQLVSGDVYLGRALSQRGQSFSFMNRFEEAKQDFENALAKFGDNEIDAQRTRSYYLHSLIESGNKEEYLKQAKLYFGTDDIDEQFMIIRGFDKISRKYAMYVYIKAYYLLFHNKEISIDRLKEIVKIYENAPDRHPWEMILKYCAFFALKMNKKDTADKWMTLANMAIRDEEGHAEGVEGEIIKGNQEQYDRLCSGLTPFKPEESRLVYMYR